MEVITLRGKRPTQRASRSRLGRFGEGISGLVSQLQPEEQDALLSRGGHGFLVRLGSDGMPEAALTFNPDHPEDRRLLRYTPLRGERLA